jgi:serine/threonine protein kinase
MDAAKGKLRELAAIANGHTLSEEEKKLRTQRIRRQLIGLGNIVPIVGITQIQRQDESGNHVDETIEILPKVNGRTLYDCIERKLLYYDTLQGLPRNQNIAIKLLLQFTQAILSLHSCGYIHGDIGRTNIMIVPNNSSLTLKLIDWGILEQTEQPSCFSVNICRMLAIFFPILLGQQHTLDKHFPEFPEQEADIKKCLMKHFRLLRKAKIYSPKTVNTIMKLLEDILLKNDENKPDLEMIISKLEALLDENEEEDNKPKENLLKC